MDKNKLNDLNVDLEELCCFLIPLFYETDCKYSCTRNKLGKLLTILAFKYAMNGERLFNEKIYRNGNCGTIIEQIMDVFEKDEYVLPEYNDDRKYIKEELEASIKLPQRFQIMPDLSFDVMNDMLDVFRNFGAYYPSDLSRVLNPIVDKVTKESHGEVELFKVPYVIDAVDSENDVVKYLKSRCIDNKNTKRKIKKYK